MRIIPNVNVSIVHGKCYDSTWQESKPFFHFSFRYWHHLRFYTSPDNIYQEMIRVICVIRSFSHETMSSVREGGWGKAVSRILELTGGTGRVRTMGGVRSVEGKLFPRDGSVNRLSGFVSSFRSDKNKQGEKKKKDATRTKQTPLAAPETCVFYKWPRLTANARCRIGFLSVSLWPEGSLLDESYFV